ncbi:hypothetical protein BDV27DRAFT_155323 [Aspergillus caelatus]|uniref:AA1-like domain-containing protein n=1 Tax=Aspergillus caelatus TaxID=61420 RepID=A0A5N7AB13_9EURO|nr:uncharacterized protein BDV27DRAFT_155323 [Aspergillus caelatus]KAE8367087.1 hypothetical protein BDV27DRAFT_155323 [Aspergillus caelatus]
MPFSAAIASAILGASFALAAPPVDIGDIDEYVKVTDLEITRAAFGKVTDVSFKLSGDDATNLACSAKNPTLGYEVADSTRCGDSDYLFNLLRGEDTGYALAVFHEFQVDGSGTYSAGQYGQDEFLVDCETNDDVQNCKSTQSPITIILTGQ